ncbi:metal-dependent hydrolase [Persicobacter diffluens]|uniref:Uncharacterized protein n=1 Tax=Persicobacter diffluens TaxID=981 RepID=A0AAN4W315_9BACT|nr:hypothetical protein PEDI_41520 [Persicobacter diffluens]
MDILSHACSGLAVGTFISSFSSLGRKHRWSILGFSTLAGALPDLDAISLWSGFDRTLGQWFQHRHLGRDIYSEKFWYSHHGFLHSLAAAFLCTALLGLLFFLINQFQQNKKTDFIKNSTLIFVAFFFGFTIHLLEDMPTPASSWGGVNFFWPSTNYTGGWGKIWWWNNYDLFLIIVSVILTNLAINTFKKHIPIQAFKLTGTVLMLGFGLALYQINTRPISFAYSGNTTRYQEFEQKSKNIQLEILGPRLYHWMEKFDQQLPFYF